MFAMRRGLAAMAAVATASDTSRVQVAVRPRASDPVGRGRPKKNLIGIARLRHAQAPQAPRCCFVAGCLAPAKDCKLVPADRATNRTAPVKQARKLAHVGTRLHWCRIHRCALFGAKKKNVPNKVLVGAAVPAINPGPTTRHRAGAEVTNPEGMVPCPKAVKVMVSQPEGRADKRALTATAGIAVSELRGDGSRGAANVVDRDQLVAFLDRGGGCNTQGCDGRLVPVCCQDKDARSCIFRFCCSRSSGHVEDFDFSSEGGPGRIDRTGTTPPVRSLLEAQELFYTFMIAGGLHQDLAALADLQGRMIKPDRPTHQRLLEIWHPALKLVQKGNFDDAVAIVTEDFTKRPEQSMSDGAWDGRNQASNCHVTMLADGLVIDSEDIHKVKVLSRFQQEELGIEGHTGSSVSMEAKGTRAVMTRTKARGVVPLEHTMDKDSTSLLICKEVYGDEVNWTFCISHGLTAMYNAFSKLALGHCSVAGTKGWKQLCKANAFGSCGKQILKDGSEGKHCSCHGMPQQYGLPARLRYAASNTILGHFTHAKAAAARATRDTGYVARALGEWPAVLKAGMAHMFSSDVPEGATWASLRGKRVTCIPLQNAIMAIIDVKLTQCLPTCLSKPKYGKPTATGHLEGLNGLETLHNPKNAYTGGLEHACRHAKATVHMNQNGMGRALGFPTFQDGVIKAIPVPERGQAAGMVSNATPWKMALARSLEQATGFGQGDFCGKQAGVLILRNAKKVLRT